MVGRLTAFVIVSSFALGACGSESTEPEASAGSGGSGGSAIGGSAGLGSGGSSGVGGGISSGGSGATVGGGGSVGDDVYVSFVAETVAGEGPALLSFDNDTDLTTSLWLADAVFSGIPPQTIVGPKVAASVQVALDTTTGKHVDGACVQQKMSSYSGPEALDPGKHYVMKMTFDSVQGFAGTLTEGAEIPFVALRAKVFDPTSNAFQPSVLTLAVPKERTIDVLHWETIDENRTSYSYAGPGTFSGETIRFTSGSGVRYQSNEPYEISGAPGYSVVVAHEPAPGAALSLPLHPVTP